MRSPRRRVSLAATAGVATALLAAGCSSSGSPSTSGPPGSTSASSSASGLEQSHITVGALPVVDDARVLLAITPGYSNEQGLSVILVPVTRSAEAGPDS